MTSVLDNSIKTISGGEALATMLQLANPAPVFGMGGFQLLPFYEACRKLGLQHVLINDERCGAFAADAFARVTNRPGLCDATLGPGATNLVTGMVESLNAGMPLVAITGNTNREHSWKNMTQESRQLDILGAAVKEVIRIEHVKRVPELMRRAFAVATGGRPGPVVLDVPEDITHAEFGYSASDFWIDPETLTAPSRRIRGDGEQVTAAARLLAKSKRPIILVGGGIHISQATEALQKLAEAHGIPVAHTMSGKGAIACTHPLSAGLFGRYSRIANDLIATSDLILVIGCKLGEIATKRFQLLDGETPLVQVDIVPEEISRTTRTRIAIASDARLFLNDLNAELGDGAAARASRKDYCDEVGSRMAKWLEGALDRLRSTERPINVGRLMHELNGIMPEDSIVVADGGFAAHWSGLLYDTKRAGRHFIANRGFASIGYGVPGGLGAQLAVGSKRRVLSLTGDGGFNMTLGELETARRTKANFVTCVFNNAASGYVKALQHAVYGAGNYQSSDLAETDYAAVANAMGCRGIRVEDPDKLKDALREGLDNTSTPTVIDIVVTRDPAKMLPGVDSRALKVEKGDRPV
jgi:acetolactate synthase I/II/III large subunit